MKINTLPEILFPNPIKHPNFKIPFLSKVKEDVQTMQYYIAEPRLSRQVTRYSIRSIKKTQQSQKIINETPSNFLTSKMKAIKEFSFIEEIEEQRTRTASEYDKRRKTLKRSLKKSCDLTIC